MILVPTVANSTLAVRQYHLAEAPEPGPAAQIDVSVSQAPPLLREWPATENQTGGWCCCQSHLTGLQAVKNGCREVFPQLDFTSS